MGAPLEFLQGAQLHRRLDSGSLRLEPAYGRVGAITDDTQLLLFTAEGLLRAWTRGRSKGITSPAGVTANAYQRWLRTQGEAGSAEVRVGPDLGLVTLPELQHRRAPGATCIEALRTASALGLPAQNQSKGCGTVMRCAPVGLFSARLPFCADRFDRAFTLGCQLSALTHGHPTGILAGGGVAAVVEQLVGGISLREALHSLLARAAREDGHRELTAALERALECAESSEEPYLLLPELGEGWIAEEAFSMACFCSLVSESLEEALTLAVMHDGDSDSVASIAGNLWGAEHGLSGCPRDWLEQLELQSVISEVADHLYDYPEQDLSRLYPGY